MLAPGLPTAEIGFIGIVTGTVLAVVAAVIALVMDRARNRSVAERLEQLAVALEATADELSARGKPTGSDAAPADPEMSVPGLDSVPFTGPTVDLDDAFGRYERAQRRLHHLVGVERQATVRLERAVRAIPDGLVVVDEHGEIVFRNDIAAEFDGGRHGDALVEAAIRQLVSGAVRDGNASTRTLELFGPPRRTMVISARPLLAEGRAVGALAVIDDITERRRLEAVRRDFVANVSHELKTPVGALSLLAETIVDEEDRQVTHRLAERMVNEATRLANTIEDLLVLSRIESEEGGERESVPIHLVVAEALNRIGPAAVNADIDIDAPEPDRRLAVLGDRRQLVSALYNLLDNAVKYSGAGSEIVVRVTTDGRNVSLAVTDEGIGIPARDMDRIFERFYRVDVARSRQTGGTGLGLSIVRHVMSNHDGAVSVNSRLGEGSTFELRLPMAATGPIAVDHDVEDVG